MKKISRFVLMMTMLLTGAVFFAGCSSSSDDDDGSPRYSIHQDHKRWRVV